MNINDNNGDVNNGGVNNGDINNGSVNNNMNKNFDILKKSEKITKKQSNSIITSEGISQDKIKQLKLENTKNIIQCNWCQIYYNNDMILQTDGNVCKHCFFSVNYAQENRLKFDLECAKKGYGIAPYILDCHESHDTTQCIRQPFCYLCDYKLKIPIKDILNYEMLDNDRPEKETNNKNNKKYVDSDEYLETYQDIMFSKNTNNTKFKIPKFLDI